MNDVDKGRFVEYTEEELLTQYMISTANAEIKRAQQTKHVYQLSCEHRHVNTEHERMEGYGERTTFRMHFRCLICGKQWSTDSK